ncbi:hypothetical protein ACIF8T_26780 [Streptomyces sp. NPDC085946]|uniref:hypothetical protein n=1 Tax=Streptomyces sp. NPDC085946 TaxID=3365744 RepID=UPI0037CE33B5
MRLTERPARDNHRVEFTEAFCRAQPGPLSRPRSPFSPQAPWQRHTDLAELRDFRERMGRRARNDLRGR